MVSSSIDSKVTIGLVGVRGYGRILAQSIMNTPKLQLAQCYHPDSSVSREYANLYSCDFATSLETLMTNEDLDAVAIVTPNHLHYELATLALENKKHVFVEKPIAHTLKHALLLEPVWKKSGCALMVGHNFRRMGLIRKIKSLINEGVLGEPVTVEIHSSHGGAFNFDESMWRWHKELCNGGPLVMIGVHMFDTLEYLLGPILSVSSIVKKLYAPTEAQDTSVSLAEFESGAVGYICNNYNMPSMKFLNIYGTEGCILTDLKRLFIRQGRDINRVPSPSEEVSFEASDGRLEQMRNFADAILNAAPVETGFYEGLRAIRFVEGALRSSEEECTIHLQEIENQIRQEIT